MGTRLLNPPTDYELKLIEELGNPRQKELAGIIISIAQEYGFIRKADLINYTQYSNHAKTKVLKYLVDTKILRVAYRSKYPKGTLKGYEPIYKDLRVEVILEDNNETYTEMADLSRAFFQEKATDRAPYINPSIEELQKSTSTTLIGIY